MRCTAGQMWALTKGELFLLWHQTDTGDWDVSMSRSKPHFFISHFTILHHAGKTKGGYPQVTLLFCPYFLLVQTSYILGKNFEISAKWLIATVSPDDTEESWQHFRCQNQKIEHRYNSPWLSGDIWLSCVFYKNKCCDIQDKASKWLAKGRGKRLPKQNLSVTILFIAIFSGKAFVGITVTMKFKGCILLKETFFNCDRDQIWLGKGDANSSISCQLSDDCWAV